MARLFLSGHAIIIADVPPFKTARSRFKHQSRPPDLRSVLTRTRRRDDMSNAKTTQEEQAAVGRWIYSGQQPPPLDHPWRLVAQIAHGGYVATARTGSYAYDGTRWQAAGDMPLVMDEEFGSTLTSLAGGAALAIGLESDSDSTRDQPRRTVSAVYDPDARQWGHSATLMWDRQYHAAVLLRDGTVLVAGGTFVGDTAGELLAIDSAETYDPVSHRWTDTAPMLSARARPALVALSGNTVAMAIGGSLTMGSRNPLDSAEVLTRSGDYLRWHPLPSMQSARLSPSALVIPDGRVVVAGDTEWLEVYDPAKGSWEEPVSTLEPVGPQPVIGLLQDGTVLIGDSQLYDPAQRVCRPVTPRPVRGGIVGCCPTPSKGVMTLSYRNVQALRFELQ
jgi:hypothetical protein